MMIGLHRKDGNLGELRILGINGDIRVTWNTHSDDEIATAKRTFDEKRKEGFLATRTTRRGIEGDRIYAFDPEAEVILLTPPLEGG